MTNSDGLTLHEFLLARIAGDEELLVREDRVYGGGGEVWTVDAHARAVAECDAKRRIVELHRLTVVATLAYGSEDGPPVFIQPDSFEDITTRRWACKECDNLGDGPCTTVRILAAVHADHSDYRAEWRP